MRLLLALLLGLWPGFASAEAVVASFEMPGDSRTVAAGGPSGATERVLEVSAPGVTGPAYAVVGEVRYEAVAGDAYLELWSHFAGGGRYFSRTLATAGPMARLSGTSGWRAFQLPFQLGDHPAPVRLEMNVVLPGEGTVWLGPVRLVQLDASGLAAVSGGGWNHRTMGVAGAVFGCVVGGLGALFGVLASRRRSAARGA